MLAATASFYSSLSNIKKKKKYINGNKLYHNSREKPWREARECAQDVGGNMNEAIVDVLPTSPH